MTALTRGSLPARVYWTRRLMVFGTAFLLMFGIARVLSGGDSPEPEQPRAGQVAGTPTGLAEPRTLGPVSPGSDRGDHRDKPHKQDKPGKKVTEPPLAEPEGPCADEDVAITPVVKNAIAGADAGIRLRLSLRTIESEACTWRVSPDTLTVKITSGDDDIWSTRQCPRAVRTRDVVVRRDVSSMVDVVWNGKRSDDECSRLTGWALPGWYHVAVAALAGEPSDVQFELEQPRRQPAEPERARDDRNRDDRNRGDRDRGEEKKQGARDQNDRNGDKNRRNRDRG